MIAIVYGGRVIKPGQLVTVNNIVYRCKKAVWNKACNTCDLKGICRIIPFFKFLYLSI